MRLTDSRGHKKNTKESSTCNSWQTGTHDKRVRKRKMPEVVRAFGGRKRKGEPHWKVKRNARTLACYCQRAAAQPHGCTCMYR